MHRKIILVICGIVLGLFACCLICVIKSDKEISMLLDDWSTTDQGMFVNKQEVFLTGYQSETQLSIVFDKDKEDGYEVFLLDSEKNTWDKQEEYKEIYKGNLDEMILACRKKLFIKTEDNVFMHFAMRERWRYEINPDGYLQSITVYMKENVAGEKVESWTTITYTEEEPVTSLIWKGKN